MNTRLADHPPLATLLRKVSMRHWLDLVLGHCRKTLLFSSTILLLAGLTHVLLHRIDWPYAAALFAMPIAVTGLLVVFLKPTLDDAARLVDQRWQCKDLMTSALWQISRSPRTNTGDNPFVLHQANERARRILLDHWHWRTAEDSRGWVIPVGIAISAVILLSTPGTILTLSSAPESVSAHRSAEPVQPVPFVALQASLKRVDPHVPRTEESDPQSETGHDDPDAAPGLVPVAVQVEENEEPGMETPADLATRNGATASTASDQSSGSSPGDEEGAMVSGSEDQQSAAPAFGYIDIERDAGEGRSDRAASLSSDLPLRQTLLARKAGPAVHADEPSGQSSLSPQMRKYSTNYFIQLRNDE